MTPPTLAWLCALAAELDEDLFARLELPALARVIDDAGDIGGDPCDHAAVLLVEIASLGQRRLAAMAAIGWLAEAGLKIQSDGETHDQLRKLVTAAAHGEATRTDVAAVLRDQLAISKGQPMFGRFTQRARKVLTLSQVEAGVLGTDFVGTEHLLLAMLAEGEGVAAKALNRLGFTLVDTRELVRGMLGDAAGNPISQRPPFTPRAKKVLELSLREALRLGHNYIGTEHLLLGIVREGEGLAAKALGPEISRVRPIVVETLTDLRIPAPTDPVVELYRVEVGATGRLSEDDEAEMQLLVREGDLKARERVIGANLRLVLDHVLRIPPGPVAALDLLQAGNHALAQAVDAWAHEPDRTPFADVALPRIAEAVADASVRARPGAVACSFCSKTQGEVQRLIAGPSVYICDQCITLSADIVAEAGVTTESTARCKNCRGDLSYAGKVTTITVDDTEIRVFVCGVCKTVLGTV